MFRRLFHASAAILMLALAYHLGASRASAQAGGLSWFVSTPHYTAALLTDRTIHIMSTTLGYSGAMPAIPGGANIVAWDAWYNSPGAGGPTASAILSDGSVYLYAPQLGLGPAWTLVPGNLLGAPTPARVESMGALKARYR